MSITSANSVLYLGATGLFTVPQLMEGFAQDDMYDMDAVDNKELLMGMDGKLSAGWKPQVKILNITLQADSVSNAFFETIYANEESEKTAYALFGTLLQPSLNKSYTLGTGYMVGFKPLADAKKTLQPRKFAIHWQTLIAVPT